MTCSRRSLHAAAAKGDIRCLRELLRRGEDPNARNEYGMTPLHYVATSCMFVGSICVKAAVAI